MIVGNPIMENVLINGSLMLLVIAERIKDLCQGQVWKANHNFFRRDSEFPQFAMARTGVRVPPTIGAP